MSEHASSTHRSAACLLIGPLAALCLAVPFVAGARERPEQKGEAAKVERKMDRALATAHQAEGEREALRHFQEAVADYADLHAKLVGKLASHEQSVASQKTLAHAIQVKRAKARPGDIFRPEVQPRFIRLIAEQFEGPDAVAARRAFFEGNPGAEDEHPTPVVVRVNAPYPSGAARSTMPPSVLATLPPLPECLHYRFVGRDLILVDAVAGLIVDFLPAAAPDLATKELP